MALLVRTALPHKFTSDFYGDNRNKHGETLKEFRCMMNKYMGLNWMNRQKLHDYIMDITDQIWPNLEFDRSILPEHKYRISFGFLRNKKTGRLDLDGFAPLQKIAIDSFCNYIGIDDSFHNIVEVRTVYLGYSPTTEETVVMQIERLSPQEYQQEYNLIRM